MDNGLVTVPGWSLVLTMVLIGILALNGTRIIKNLENLLLAQSKKTDRALAELGRVQGIATIIHVKGGWVIARDDRLSHDVHRYVDMNSDGSYTFNIDRAKVFGTAEEAIEYAKEVHFYTGHQTL